MKAPRRVQYGGGPRHLGRATSSRLSTLPCRDPEGAFRPLNCFTWRWLAMPTPTHYTITQAARRCGLSEAALRHAIQRGRLPVDRTGRRLLISAAALDAYLRERY